MSKIYWLFPSVRLYRWLDRWLRCISVFWAIEHDHDDMLHSNGPATTHLLLLPLLPPFSCLCWSCSLINDQSSSVVAFGSLLWPMYMYSFLFFTMTKRCALFWAYNLWHFIVWQKRMWIPIPILLWSYGYWFSLAQNKGIEVHYRRIKVVGLSILSFFQ